MKHSSKIDNKYYKILGQNIRNQRNLKGLSQEELGFRISSTRNYIGCIERGEKYPSIAFLIEIAKELGCNIQVFFDKMM